MLFLARARLKLSISGDKYPNSVYFLVQNPHPGTSEYISVPSDVFVGYPSQGTPTVNVPVNDDGFTALLVVAAPPAKRKVNWDHGWGPHTSSRGNIFSGGGLSSHLR